MDFAIFDFRYLGESYMMFASVGDEWVTFQLYPRFPGTSSLPACVIMPAGINSVIIVIMSGSRILYK